MSGKGSISRMSDECLMKQETVFSFYTQYQAVMRKFTLAGKAIYSLKRRPAVLNLIYESQRVPRPYTWAVWSVRMLLPAPSRPRLRVRAEAAIDLSFCV